MTHKELAKELKISRQTVGKFFRGEPVDRQYFVQICEELQLEWDEIAAKPARKATVEAKKQDSGLDIDELVQKVRVFCRDKIQHQCGTMQLLDVSHPVELDNLYVDVNILEKIPSQRWLDISKRLQDFNPTADSFDRFYLGEVRQEQIPGLEAAAKNSKLMVLGKPGSGKTTFLKHIAIECSKGKFQANCVPIFIGLKRFTDNIRNTTNVGAQGLAPLQAYINQQLQICDVADADVESLLKHGRALILLDGLDEVSEQDSEVVRQQITWLYEQYFKNQFVMTCRTQAQKYRFDGFAYVEVADFNQKQIEAFAKKWFLTVARTSRDNGLTIFARFIKKLDESENKRVRELAVTPILLSLICLVFNDLEEFPQNRLKLYEQGIDILLTKWDESRSIKRDEVYQSLSLEHKIELLGQVASITFKKNHYFFEQDEVEQCIIDYLCTLPNAHTEQFTLQQDSRVLLKSIEAQHGLLVERAKKIYSFSHLIYHEYFTASNLVNSSNSYILENIVNSITDDSWREVFLLVARMLWNVDKLLKSMKHKIDELIASDEKLQQVIKWVIQKSLAVEVPYKSEAVRAFYLSLDLAINSEPITNRTFDFDIELARSLNCNLGFNSGYSPSPNFIFYTPKDYAMDRAFDFDLDRVLVRSLSLCYTIDPAFDKNTNLDSVMARVLDSKLARALEELIAQIPVLYRDSDKKHFKQWWKVNGQAWTEQLRSVMIKHRNIGHDWQLSKQQSKLLKQYYDASKLLVDCLNSGCEVSEEVRSQIEDTLFLPIAEIEKRNRESYL